MSRDEERLPAPVLSIQQSGHDMMPIIVCLPFNDVTSNTDDFLVTVTYMCIDVCMSFIFLEALYEKRKRNPTVHIFLFN